MKWIVMLTPLALCNGDGIHIEKFNADDPLGMQSVESFNFADARQELPLGDGTKLPQRPRWCNESRRWHDGDSTVLASNQGYWRTAA